MRLKTTAPVRGRKRKLQKRTFPTKKLGPLGSLQDSVSRLYQALPNTFLEAWHLQLEADARKLFADTTRMLFFLHGGALVALLALAGNALNSPTFNPELFAILAEPFAIGLVLIITSAGCNAFATLLTTSLYMRHWIRAKPENDAALLMVIFALAAGGTGFGSLLSAGAGFLLVAEFLPEIGLEAAAKPS